MAAQSVDSVPPANSTQLSSSSSAFACDKQKEKARYGDFSILPLLSSVARRCEAENLLEFSIPPENYKIKWRVGREEAGRQAAKIGRCRPLGGMVAAAELCQARLYEWGGRFPIAFCVGQRGEMACESEACDAGRRSERDGRGRLNGRKKEGVKLGHV